MLLSLFDWPLSQDTKIDGSELSSHVKLVRYMFQVHMNRVHCQTFPLHAHISAMIARI